MKPQIYVLMPFGNEHRLVYDTLKEVGTALGMTCMRADEDLTVGNVIQTTIRKIYESDVIIADITGNNANVFYELGVANALSKPCLAIRRQSDEPFPFDVGAYVVIQYEDTQQGQKNLKENLVRLLETAEDIRHPVNDALEAIIQRSRLVMYVLYGASGGAILGALTSYAGLLGAFCRPVMKTTTFGMVTAGCITGLVSGAVLFGAYAFLGSIGYSKVTRLCSTLTGGLLGIILGVLLFASTQAIFRGTENQSMAWSVGLAYLLLSCLSGTIFGLSMDIKHPQLSISVPSLSTYTLKVMTLTLALMGAFIISVNVFKQNIFDSMYLQNFRLMDSIGATTRFALWCMSMLIFHWWLKWKRKL